MQFLGQGCTREVYALTDDLVLKVASENLPSNRAENLAERNNWLEAVRLGLDHLLAPVVACAEDGSWLIMRRCIRDIDQPVPYEATVQIHDEISSSLSVCDTLPFNLGWFDGRPVLLDYSR
jgi:hypothetical protein